MDTSDLLRGLHLSPTTGDIIFVVDNEEIRCHRTILESACPHFKKVINDDSNQVKIDGTSANAFRELIRFIYFGQLEIKYWNMEDTLNLLSLANQYQFHQLFTEVEKILTGKPLDVDSWKLVNSASSDYDSDALKAMCTLFAETKVDEFLRQRDLQKYSAELVSFMVTTLKASSCNQEKLFRAVYEWRQYHSSAEIISVFQNIGWENMPSNITAIILKDVFGNTNYAKEIKVSKQVAAAIIAESQCVARVNNVWLLEESTVGFELPNFKYSLFCGLTANSIEITFRAYYGIDVPVKGIEWESSNYFIVNKVFGETTKYETTEMIFSEPTSTKNGFKYNASFPNVTPVNSIEIISKQSKFSKMKLHSVVIY